MNSSAASETRPPAEGEIPLSLYVHLPWCVRKCPYCDFNSHPARDSIPERDYLAALIRDLEFELEQSEPRPIQSIFIGGGTPSLFSSAGIAELLEGLAKRLQFTDAIEITLEANPGSAEALRFAGYRAAGVNRLSIGVQSFDAEKLRALGRIHGPEDALDAVDMARGAGFSNLNLDLMFALPRQSLEQAMADLERAIALSPAHLSWYHLTLEPNTEFAVMPPALPDEDAAADIHDAGLRALASAGFDQYETSAFAKADMRCAHNLNYWSFGDYLALGAGAHAKRSVVSGSELQIVRRARQRHPKAYLEHAGRPKAIQEQRFVQPSERPFEFCMNALRLNQGFSLADYRRTTGLSESTLDKGLEKARAEQLVDEAAGWVRPSPRGRQFQNRLLGMFL